MIELTEKEKQIYTEKFNHFRDKVKEYNIHLISEHDIHKALAEIFSELCCSYVLLGDFEKAKLYARLFEYANHLWITTLTLDKD